MKRLLSSILLALPLLVSSNAEERKGENVVVALTEVSKPGQILSLGTTRALPLYDTRSARRILATLPAGQTLTVIAMDQYGLQVRGKGKNGPINGWISQKAAFQESAGALTVLAQLYQRQQDVEGLVAKKQVAIGMTLPELTRILGTPTNHHIVAESGRRAETATWTKTDTVDMGKAFSEPFADVGVTPPVLEMVVETGRITATLAGGVATAIDSNLGGAAQQIPEIVTPIAHPFLVTTGD